MKRNSLIAGVFALALCLIAAPASAGKFAVGAYGGYQWPIVQDDADPGGLFGLKGKIRVGRILDLEPNITWIKNGDVETDLGGTLPGPDVTSYALNGTLTFGGAFGLTGGIGWSSVDIGVDDATNNFTLNVGLALEIPVGPLALDISPRLLVINTDSGASRKHALLMAGLNYWF